MVSGHPSFHQPMNNIRLWRYMDIAKFLHLLQTQQLFFSTATLLGDPFEGSVPTRMSASYVKSKFNRPSQDAPPDVVDAEDNSHALEQLARYRMALCQSTYVSCWHMGAHESAAMWQVYSKSPRSICVQTRLNLLNATLPDQVYVGMVNYIDYEIDAFPDDSTFNPFVHKRVSFQHERELRAVFQVQEGVGGPDGAIVTDAGAAVSVDVSKLLENVFINPLSPPWFTDVVNDVVSTYGFSFPVLQSKLSQNPLY